MNEAVFTNHMVLDTIPLDTIPGLLFERRDQE